ncbi:SOS response-associated peptidase family protein [Methylocystis sp. H62]|uniref:SOS response-associated peptidase family protein n=1 Tax=Methylocystis sp. H62 TaxID=2785789 RepID=UPI0018C1D50D|nr:SOS response-associated peptidase family protein [Methylocystis sp. H62]MBG0791977.1 SOS response-associated peptidase family protein [Methylocystis sp. H62]
MRRQRRPEQCNSSPTWRRYRRPLHFRQRETWRDAESDAQVDSATIIVGAGNNWMARFDDRMPIILDWRDACAWMAGDDPGALLHSPPEDALQEWIVSPRVNRSGVGDADPALIAEIFETRDF